VSSRSSIKSVGGSTSFFSSKFRSSRDATKNIALTRDENPLKFLHGTGTAPARHGTVEILVPRYGTARHRFFIAVPRHIFRFLVAFYGLRKIKFSLKELI